ncbi:MAG: stage 0 sporulation family protein [Candidatus Omnitrophica bacterium]|nr:stage 0 sporulation family protein [Candidatus Omnitrophota bacterium]MCM8826048.1 stage 0 sporulation family protein [Candidatus Omnitrophota bacterium]
MKIALVRLREAGSINTYFVPDDVKVNDYVIIEADRGLDYGEVLEVSSVNNEPGQINNILRKATEEDFKCINENRKEAEEAMKICGEKIGRHNLKMKLVEAEYSFDKKKIVFYFTAEGRVDFRELVKDLAKEFKVRIEMRQIGVRDETRIFGGVGPCGRKLCCALFLKNFEPVSIKMAKLQRLPLNPSKVSGICGRLMCCLSYEYKNYQELAKGLPREGDKIDTPNGKAKVISVNVLKRMVYVEFDDGRLDKIVFETNDSGDKI